MICPPQGLVASLCHPCPPWQGNLSPASSSPCMRSCFAPIFSHFFPSGSSFFPVHFSVVFFFPPSLVLVCLFVCFFYDCLFVCLFPLVSPSYKLPSYLLWFLAYIQIWGGGREKVKFCMSSGESDFWLAPCFESCSSVQELLHCCSGCWGSWLTSCLTVLHSSSVNNLL